MPDALVCLLEEGYSDQNDTLEKENYSSGKNKVCVIMMRMEHSEGNRAAGQLVKSFCKKKFLGLHKAC